MKPKAPVEPELPPPASDIEALLREHAIASDATHDPKDSLSVSEAKNRRFWEIDAELGRWREENGPVPQEVRDAVRKTHPTMEQRGKMLYPDLRAVDLDPPNGP